MPTSEAPEAGGALASGNARWGLRRIAAGAMARAWAPLMASVLACAPTGAAAQGAAGEVSVYAAGSLRAALGDVVRAWQAAQPGASARLSFGASGLLKDRLLGGERADVFASANMEHPLVLADAGRAAAPRVFARNRLCGLATPQSEATPETLVARLLDPQVRVGTSTPRADPASDYAFQMFERIERAGHPGAAACLAAKALQLTGGPQSPPPPRDRSVYAALMAEGRADVFITYCTNVVTAQAEVPGLKRIEIPPEINVSASYGVSILAGAVPGAESLVRFLLDRPGQDVLARHGFAPP